MRTRVAAARQWTGNGLEAVRRGAVCEARACFAKASSQLPTDHQIIANVARTHYQEGQFDQAIEQMNRAIRIKNDEPELLVELGEYHLAAGNLAASTELVEKILDRNHRLASAWLLKGKIHAARGEHQTALGDFQKAIGIDASNDEVQLQIVQAYRKLGNPLRALSAVEKLLDKYPRGQQPELALIEKSMSLVELDQHDTAIETLKSALARNNGSGELRTALARAQELSRAQSDTAIPSFIR
jgi:tetratricopeptide (TPR) repeat protein